MIATLEARKEANDRVRIKLHRAQLSRRPDGSSHYVAELADAMTRL
jgi:hypothetical protein